MTEPLDLVLRRSIARCETRWLAAGVPPELAQELAADSQLGAPSPELLPTASSPLRVLVAEVGAGKSLLSERALQRAVADHQSNPVASIPCWIRVRDMGPDLENAVVETTQAIGDVHAVGAFVVLDGADEPGVGQADDALQQARQLVRVLPNTRVLLSTRPLPPFSGASEAVAVPPLDEAESWAIVTRIWGEEVTIGRAAAWPQSLQQAIRRPLFAVLLGVYLREHDGRSPGSPAQLLREVVERSLGRAAEQDRELLRRIAVKSVAAGGAPVPRGEAGSAAAEEALANTRLVTVGDDHLAFPLVLIAQWFAAESLALGEVPSDALTSRPEDLELWRYPAAIAVGAFGEEQASRILAPLAEQHAGFASQVVEEALARWSLEGSPVVSADDAGNRIRSAMASWIVGVGDLAPLCAPTDEGGQLLPIGVHAEGEWLDTGWYVGAEPEPAIRALPGSGWAFMAGALDSEGLQWIRVRGARPGGQAAWPWRWSFEDLRDALQRVLKGRRLEMLGTPMRAAHLWLVAKAVLELGFLARDPVPLDDVLERLDPKADVLLSGWPPRAEVRIQPNRRALEELRDQGVTVLEPALEPPRPDYTGGWVWNAWDLEGHLKRTREAYELALATFEHLVAGPFRSLAPWMQTASTLPAVIHVGVSFSDRADFEGAPLEDMWLEPLPEGSQSRVEVHRAEGRPDWTHDVWQERIAELRRLRPLQARWIGMVLHHGVLDLDEDTAAEELVYQWLWSDLQRIKWVDGMLGQRPYGRDVPL